MNFFKLYIGDYQRDTAHLSVTEHGAFMLMLQHYYATEKPLPSGKALHRMLRAQDKAERDAIDAVVGQFWNTTDAGLVNVRADAEITKAMAQAETNRSIAQAREDARKAAREKHEQSTNRATNDQPNHSHSHSQLKAEAKECTTCIADSPSDEPAANVIPADELEGRRKRTVIACPVQRIAELWDEVLPELASPIVWSDSRKSAVSTRWREMAVFHGWKTQEEGIDWFRRTLVAIRGSPFLMGKVQPRNRDQKPFAMTLDWMFGPRNFLKVVEGRYHEQR